MAETENMGLPLPDDGSQAWGSAIRGAFETIDGEVGVIGDLIDALHLLTEAVSPSRSLPYAKTVSDEIRASVGGTVSTNANWGSNNGWPSYYSTGGPASMDARDTERAHSNGRAHSLHSSWVVT